MSSRLSQAEGRLAKTEAELAVTQDDLAVTKDELAKTEVELVATKDFLAKSITDQAEALTCLAIKDDLTSTKEALMSKTDELEREVAILRAPLYIHACGSHNDFLYGSMTIPYTSLLYSSTNTEGGGLDITTGVFTAPWGGSYTVSWDTLAILDYGEYVNIFLQKNGENIEESRHNSYYESNERVQEQGGRTMVVYLAMGDTLQLYRDSYNTGEIRYTTFCVSL